jgi:type III pantothenate kinase
LLINIDQLNLVIDIGNTLLKIAVFKNNSLIVSIEFKDNFKSNIEGVLDKYPITHSILCNVSNSNEGLNYLLSIKTKQILFNESIKVPFTNSYSTISTFGKDRIALVSAASKEFSNQNVLIIDLGSCITYDFKNSKNHYLGGSISPGIHMRYKSLNDNTANLPLLNFKNITNFVGKSTEESIHSGVVNGVIHEVNGIISQYKNEFKEIRIILTGGDSKFLLKKIKNTIFAHSNFLLVGLNFLVESNKIK